MLAVGSYDPFNKKSELYKFGTDAWNTVEDYPDNFCSGSGVAYYDMVYVPDILSFFVVGGVCRTTPNLSFVRQIAMYKDGAWSEAGQLNSYQRSVSFNLFFLFLTNPILRSIAPCGLTTHLSL